MIKRIIAWLNEPAKDYIELVKVDNGYKFAWFIPNTPRWKFLSKSGKVYTRTLTNRMTDYEYFSDF